STWPGLFLLHEVIADHMAHDHVRVFNPSHVRGWDLYVELGQRAELAAVAPGESDRPASDRARIFDGPQYVRRITGAADPHEQVAGMGEILELLDEHRVVGKIVGVGGECRELIGQRHDAKTRGAVEAGAFYDVAGKVGRRRGAAAVAADEDMPPVRARVAVQPHGLSRFAP